MHRPAVSLSVLCLLAVACLLCLPPATAARAQEFAAFLENAEKNERTLPHAWNFWVESQASRARKKHRCGLLERGAETLIAEYAEVVDRDPERFHTARLDLRVLPVLRAHSCAAISAGNKIVAMEEALREEDPAEDEPG